MTSIELNTRQLRNLHMFHAAAQQISRGTLVLRTSIGCFMLVHGIQKIQGFSKMSEVFPHPLGAGNKWSLIPEIGAEVGCSALLILGFATRLAVAALAFTVIVALFVVHRADP